MSTSLTTIGDIKTEFLVRMNVSTTVAYYTDSIINNWIDQAHKMASNYRKWPMTEARVSTTFASLVTDEDGQLSGQYPEGWKPRSLRMVQVGGFHYDKKSFYAYRNYIETFPQSNNKFFTDYGLLYYVNAGAGGSGTVALWGQYTPNIDLSDPTSNTIFSGINEDGNQAILELMMSFALTRERSPASIVRGKFISAPMVHVQNAMGLLDGVWKTFTDESFGYQQPDNDGMFKRMDIVGGGLREDLFKRDQFI